MDGVVAAWRIPCRGIHSQLSDANACFALEQAVSVAGHRSLLALILAFLALCMLYNAITPLGEGPDEPGHAGYVFFLAREGRLPVQCASPCVSDVPGSGHHPPLAYLLALPAALWLSPDRRAIDLPGNPRFTWAGGDQVNAATHGSREQWPWDDQVLAWRLARLASTLAGALTIVATYLAARTVQQPSNGTSSAHAERMPLLAASLVAFNPQFVFTASLVSNDALLAACSATLLWLVMSGRQSLRRALAAGLVLGLALVTKQSGLVLAPIALGWCVVAGGGCHDAPRRPLWQRLSPVLVRIAIVAGGAAMVSGWWYGRNWRLYGDPFGLQLFQAEFITQAFDAVSLAAWAGALATLYESFWARFGWMNLPAPAWVYLVYGVVVLAGLAGWFNAAGRGRVSVAAHWPLVVLLMLTLAWLVSFALTAGLVAWQGRLLFPALPAIAMMLARGLTGWQTTHEVQEVLDRLHPWRLLIAALVLLAVWLPFGVIRPAYPFETLPEPVARAWRGVPVYARFARTTEPGAVIRAWRLEGALRPGATLELTLLWHALSRQDRNWVTFVHLVDGSGTIVVDDDREPRDGAYPMVQWVAGDWIEARYVLALPANLPPGAYTLRVGLWDPATNRRAAFFDDDDVRDPEGDHAVLTTVLIAE